MIRIYTLEGKAFVWNYTDVRRIREEHRIVGVLVGALPRKPRQNVRLGLPLELLPEEARLLLEKGLATLVKNPTSQSLGDDRSQDPLFPGKVAAYEKELEENYQEQLRLSAEQRKIVLDCLADRIAQGRAKKWQQKGEGGALQRVSIIPVLSSGESIMMIPAATEQTQRTGRRGNRHMTDEPPAALALWCPQQDTHADALLALPDPPPLLSLLPPSSLPPSLLGRALCMQLRKPLKGDFLIYPGDPMRFHAHYIALCFSKDAPISLCDIISAGRLGTNVKKTVLLCSVNQGGTVAYTSLQWSGMQ